MTSTTDLTASLALHRATHAGATRLAARIWPFVEALRKARLWLPREAALRYMSHAIWCNTGYDACTNYESAEEFAVELRPDLDAGWPEREELEGVEHHVLRPFFSETPYLHEAGLGSLRTCKLADIKALNSLPHERPACEPVLGLSDEELMALVSMHHSATLAIVNAVRHLTTALSYPISALSRLEGMRRELALVIEHNTAEKLSALVAAVVLPGVDAPDSYFSSNWDKTGLVRNIAPESALAVFLRDC